MITGLLLALFVVEPTAYAAGAAQAENAYDDGVVAHGAWGVWRMNDASGALAQAYLNTMTDGTYAGGHGWTTSCGPNVSVYTDQQCSTDGMTVPVTGTIGGAGVWWRASTSAGTNVEASLLTVLGPSGCASGIMIYGYNSAIYAQVINSGTYYNSPGGSNVTWTAGNWYYIAVTQSGSGAWTWWVNGVAQWTVSTSSAQSGYMAYLGTGAGGGNNNCFTQMPGDYSEGWYSRGAYTGVAQDFSTMGSGAGPPVDTLGNGGNPVTQRPTGIAPIVAATCAAPTDWTNIQQYISWLSCQIQNTMAAVLNPVITVLNWGMNLVAWFFDFSRPIATTPLSALGSTARTRFPFSIPFDVGAILNAIFGATPTAPAFDLQLHSGLLGTNLHAAFNLSWMSPLMPFIRWGELSLFTVGLGLAYRKWSGGGW